MKLYQFSLAAAAALAVACSTNAIHAQTPDTTANDKQFVMDASEGGMAEIAQSKVALRKSKNPDVRAYAQQMIDDHTRLMAQMKPVADQLGVTPPTQLKPAHQIELKRLNAMSGKSFDDEYIKSMDIDHHKTLMLFKNELANTTNDQLKADVQQGEPVIQDHTDKADQLSQKMGLPIAAGM
jgi:putative membrane protein